MNQKPESRLLIRNKCRLRNLKGIQRSVRIRFEIAKEAKAHYAHNESIR